MNALCRYHDPHTDLGGRNLRVSEYFRLGLTQPSLEFLDVHVDADTRVFVDPHAFRFLGTDWADECVSALQNFYDQLIDAISRSDEAGALALLAHSGESNEVHLGMSSGSSQGSGVGPVLAKELYDALAASRAVTTGLASDIEETALFVPGILHDRVSDMTINVVRTQLVNFTQEMCDKYDITPTAEVDAGFAWDRRRMAWTTSFAELPMVENEKLLLIPRAVVRKKGTFSPDDYLRNYVLPYMQKRELAKTNSPLVRHYSATGKNKGAPYVTKKSILESTADGPKELNTKIAEEDSTTLERYREKAKTKTEPLGHEQLSDVAGTPLPEWDDLLEAVLRVPAGKPDADAYHRAVQNLLTALFYPALDKPEREFKTHEGRKRIDINYANLAETGFFAWLRDSQKVECGSVVVECKNYIKALANPEYDQITSRFSPKRGRFGLLLYRGFGSDKTSVVQHFRDAALDDRGYVIALEDDDLKILVASRKADDGTEFDFLLNRFRELI